ALVSRAKALALKQRAPLALRVLHRAESPVRMQGDAGAVGLGDDEPGAGIGHCHARAVKDVHQGGLDGNQLRLPGLREDSLDCRDELTIDGARKARLAARAFARPEEPALGALAVDLGEMMAQVR